MKQFIIDVRELEEYKTSHVEGSHNIPLSQLSVSHPILAKLPYDTDIVVYCRSGGRASRAKAILESIGFSSVENGINEEMIKKS